MVAVEKMSRAPAPFLELQNITLFGDVPTQTVDVAYCGDTTVLLFSHSSQRCVRVTFSAKIIFQSASHRSSKQGFVFKTQTVSFRKKSPIHNFMCMIGLASSVTPVNWQWQCVVCYRNCFQFSHIRLSGMLVLQFCSCEMWGHLCFNFITRWYWTLFVCY
jgi:hypothetical protein